MKSIAEDISQIGDELYFEEQLKHIKEDAKSAINIAVKDCGLDMSDTIGNSIILAVLIQSIFNEIRSTSRNIASINAPFTKLE
jgi:endoglucanase Acf2